MVVEAEPDLANLLVDSFTSETDLRAILQARMGWLKPGMIQNGALEYLGVHRIRNGNVAVFIVANGTPAIIEDPADLYPSDALVTKLRML